jgi:hypothetical protein
MRCGEARHQPDGLEVDIHQQVPQFFGKRVEIDVVGEGPLEHSRIIEQDVKATELPHGQLHRRHDLVPLTQVAGDEDALRALLPHQGSRLFPGLALYVHDCYCGRALASHFDGSSPAHALAGACDQANSIG